MNKLAMGFMMVSALAAMSACKKGADSSGGNAMAKMTEFKDKMCACKDADCAKKVSDEMTAWGNEQAKNQKTPAKMSDADQKKAQEIGTQMGECMTKAMTPAAGAGEPAAQPAGDTAAPAGGAAGAADATAICAKLEELAKKEGGEAEKDFNAKLKDDCTKEIEEQAGKKGAAAVTEFKACLDKAESFSKAMDTCKQID